MDLFWKWYKLSTDNVSGEEETHEMVTFLQ